MGYLEHVIAMEEISRASASVGLCTRRHSNLCVNQIRLNGTDEQKRHYLPAPHQRRARRRAGDERSGRRLGCRLSMTPACREATATATCLNGTKLWITNGPDANTLVVYAKTEPAGGVQGHHRLHHREGLQGFHRRQKLDKLGMRGSNTCELVFEDCEVPAENVLGRGNGGVRVLMSGLDYERAVLAGGPLGIMQACLDVGAALCARAQAIRPADRLVPAHAGQGRRHVRRR